MANNDAPNYFPTSIPYTWQQAKDLVPGMEVDLQGHRVLASLPMLQRHARRNFFSVTSVELADHDMVEVGVELAGTITFYFPQDEVLWIPDQ